MYRKADNGLLLMVGDGDGQANRNLIITSYSNYSKEHGLNTLGANPTLYGFSLTDPSLAGAQYWSITHNQTNGVIATGAGDISLVPAGNDVLVTGTKGQATGIGFASASVTFAADPGDASKTATGLRTGKRKILGISGRVTTAGTNCASINIGDGVDADRYGAAIAVADETVFDADDATADPSEWLASDGDVVVTAVGGNCFGLVVALTVHTIDHQAATAD